MNKTYKVKSDSDGFLIGRGGQDVLQSIVNDTAETLAILQGGKFKGAANKVDAVPHIPSVKVPRVGSQKVTVKIDGGAAAMNAAKVTKVANVQKNKVSSNSVDAQGRVRDSNGRFISSGERKTQSETRNFRTKTIDNAVIQTAVLRKLVKKVEESNNRGGKSGGGLLSKLGGAAMLGKSLLGGGAAKGGVSLLGRVLKGGGLKAVAKGGIFGAIMAGIAGMNVENSDMERGDKNKQHFKNILGAGGGVAGAMAGAAIGQAVIPIPIVGAVVGAVAGGLLGTNIVDSATNAIDKRFDPNMSRKMFSSWEGFTSTVTTASKDFWANNAPKSWQDMTKSIADKASQMWEKTKETAAAAKEYIVESKPVQAIKQGATAAASYAQNSAPVRWAVDFGSGLTKSKDGVTYNMGGKDYRDGTIDCSGWVTALNKDVSGQINKLLGKEAAKDVRIDGGGGAAGIIKSETKKGRLVASAKSWSSLNRNDLKSGMIIGESRGGHAKGRYKNIGHIVTIIEENGKKYVSESTSAKGKDGKSGVRKTELSEYIKELKRTRKSGDNFGVHVVDPYAAYRDKLGGMKERETTAYKIGNAVAGAVPQIAAANVLKGGIVDLFRSKKVKAGNNKALQQSLHSESTAAQADYLMKNFKGGRIGNYSENDTAAYAAMVAATESGFNYRAKNDYGYIGAYQMGAEALEDVGLVKKGTGKRGNRALADPSVWNIKGGREAFFNNRDLQDRAFVDYTNKNIAYLMNGKYKISAKQLGLDGDFGKLAFAMKASHLKGHSGGGKLLRYGVDSKDANGQSARKYGQQAADVKHLFLAASANVRGGAAIPVSAKSIASSPKVVSAPKVPAAIKPIAVKAETQASGGGIMGNVGKSAVSANQIVHKPTEQTVSNRQIAHIASGTIHSK